MEIMNLGESQTMSSREIADLIEKRHDHIRVSIDRLAARGVIGTPAPREFDHNGNTYTQYFLNKRDSLIVVAQNCPEFTARVIDRWQELEQANTFKVPQTLSEALMLGAELARQVEAQQLQLEAQKPAVAFVERFVEAKSSKCLSDVAKILGQKPHAFIARLSEDGVIFKRGGSWLPYQHHIDAGRFKVKTGEASGHAFEQTRVDPKGIEWLAKMYGD